MSKTLILKPRLSEKSYAHSEQLNTYVFDVPAGSNRHDVMRAIAAQYEVGVEAVRIASVAGKTRRAYKRRSRVSNKGQTSRIRKAYVTLKEGEKLAVFAAVEESSKQEGKEK